jgi:hypothetical protein
VPFFLVSAIIALSALAEVLKESLPSIRETSEHSALSWLWTLVESVAAEPIMMIRAGLSRLISAVVDAGKEPVAERSAGPCS